ncbi:MAG: hypothetical protein KTR31_00015 [Myxococcales bacterium]|nr:hypothetical protein [Myxococcales bacterium]
MFHLLALVGLVGCVDSERAIVPEGGGQTFEDGTPELQCDGVQSTTVGLTEQSVAGFDAEELLDLVAGAHVVSPIWEVDSDADLTLTVTHVDGVIAWEDVGPPLSDGADCRSWMRVEVSLSLASSDGLLDETWETGPHLQAFELGEVVLGPASKPMFQGGQRENGALNGSLTYADLGLASPDDLYLRALLTFVDGNSHGALVGEVYEWGEEPRVVDRVTVGTW